MPVSAEHQTVVTFELIRIDDTSSANLLDGETQQYLRRNFWDGTDLDDAPSLQDAEDGNFAGGSTASVAFSSSSEVGFIQFYLPTQENIGVGGMTQDGHPDRVHGPVNGPVRQLHLLGHLSDGDFQFKELEDRQPLNTGQTTMIDPTARKIMERIFTAGASVPFVP
jgi:hypothetical protein